MRLRPSLNDSDEEHWQWLIKTRNDDDCDTGSMKPRSNRAFHWSFVIPSHDEDVVTKLKNLTNADVVYAAMAICKDDTGNNFIQGFIRTHVRARVTGLTKIIGPAIFTVCSTPNSVKDILMEIKMWDHFEVGDLNWTTVNGYHSDLSAFKEAADSGASIEILEAMHPKVFKNYPGLVLKYVIRKRKRSTSIV